MQQSNAARRYPMLRFAGHVDWKHMKLGLLNRLNQLAADHHVIIYVFSGYRSDSYSEAHGGFRGDPHTHGIAADATVNGKPIGKYFSLKTLAKYGLRSGNVPNFYHGKPDPEHVDMIGYGYSRTGQVDGSKTEFSDTAAAAAPQPVGNQVPQTQDQVGLPMEAMPSLPQTTTPPEASAPPEPLLPGTLRAGDYWKRVLEQPGVSSETQAYAGLFQ